MAFGKTFAIVKPDGVMKGLVSQILLRYKDAGLSVEVVELHVRLQLSQVAGLYLEHRGKPYFEGLLLSMTSGPCAILWIEGENAVERVRRLNGPTKDAPEGTIRGDFKSAGGPFNIVHAPDSLAAAEREWEALGFKDG
ncbi:MAG TPA: nucleoside-diphosphate kinase [Candidatus Paceibacterota bacterium]